MASLTAWTRFVRVRGGAGRGAAMLAVFHDAEEVITGDLPTPIKAFDPQVAQAIDSVEADDEAWACVKAADRICAYVKCVEEHKAGNAEFERAEEAIRAWLEASDDPAVQAFLAAFVPSFRRTLDELN